MNYVSPIIHTYAPTGIVPIPCLAIFLACWIGYFVVVKVFYTCLWLWHRKLKPGAKRK